MLEISGNRSRSSRILGLGLGLGLGDEFGPEGRLIS